MSDRKFECSGLSPDMAGRIAHEIRSPLGVVGQCLAELLRSDALPPAQTALLELAQRSMGRLHRCSNRLAQVRELAADQPTSRSPQALREILTEAIAAAQQAVHRRAPRPELKIDDEVADIRVGHGQAVRIVVEELARNAIQHAKSSVVVEVVAHAAKGWAVTFAHDGSSLHEALSASRNDNSSSGTLGIGLYLAELAAGRVQAKMSILKNCVRVDFPKENVDEGVAPQVPPSESNDV